jgi:phospholipid transport system substrate-binding protein
MRKFFRMDFLYAVQFLLFAGLVQASAESPETVVRQAAENMYRALQQECLLVSQHPQRLFVLVDENLLPHTDFGRMSRWVMGKYWKRASEDQRQQFIHEFRVLLVRTYGTAVQKILPENIRYLPVRASIKPNQAVVRTELRQPGEPMLHINYRMYRKGGHWLVYDVRIEGVSLVTNYRNSFAPEIKVKGVQGLIDALKQKNQRQALKTAGTIPSSRGDSC